MHNIRKRRKNVYYEEIQEIHKNINGKEINLKINDYIHDLNFKNIGNITKILKNLMNDDDYLIYLNNNKEIYDLNHIIKIS